MSIIPYIVVFIVAFVLGWQVRQYIAIKNIQRIIERLEQQEEQEQEQDKQLIKLKIEQHGSCYYAYGLEDDRFLSQGTSRQELEDNLRARFPGKRFGASDTNLKELFDDSI